MVLIILSIIVLGLLISGITLKNHPLLLICALASGGVGILQLSTNEANSEGWLLGWVLLCICFAAIVESIVTKVKGSDEEFEAEMEQYLASLPKEDDYKNYLEDQIARTTTTSKRARLRKMLQRGATSEEIARLGQE